jgi:hypothetical protein
MATGPGFGTNVGWDFSYANDLDMTNNQFKFVVLGTDGYLDVATAGVVALGVLQDNPNGSATLGIMSQVRTGGVSKVGCGGTFSQGQLLSSNSSGLAVLYTAATVFTGTPYSVSGTQVLGIANEPGAAGGGFSSMLFRPSGLSA